MADPTLESLGITDHPDDANPPDGTATPKEFGDALTALGIKEHPDDTVKLSPGGVPLDPVTGRPRVVIRGREPVLKDAPEAVKKAIGYAEQATQGIPIVSPIASHLAAASQALAETIAPPSKNVSDVVSGQKSVGDMSFGEKYSSALDAMRGASAGFAKENPKGSTAANIVGAVGSAIPMAGTGLGAAAMGLRGPSLAWRMLGGTVGQGAIGGTDAALRGDNPLIGAGVGAAGGAAGPMLGEGAAKVGGAAANYLWPRQGALSQIDPININRLINATAGETPQTLAAASDRVGQHGFVGDLNQGLTDLTGATAVTPGTGKPIVRGAYQARADAQGGRIEDALTKALGPKLDQVQLGQMTTDAFKKRYDPLYAQWRSMEVHPTQGIKDLIPRLKEAKAFGMAKELSGISGEPINQNFFTGGPQKAFPTTQSWDYIKQALDRRIGQAYKDENGGPLARVLVGLKHDMIDEISKTPAGKVWNQARSAFADKETLLEQQAAGRDTFLGGRSGTSVDELRHELQTLSVPEMVARRQGMRAAASEVMGATRNGDTRLRNMMLAPNNQEKIRLMMGGGQPAEDLINSMEHEAGHGEKAMDVLGNNATGASNVGRAERKNMLMPEPAREYGLDLQKPATWVPPSIRDQFSLAGMINSQRTAAHSAANEQLARILTMPNNPQSIALLKAVQNEGARQSLNYGRSQAAGNLLAGAISGPGTSVARRRVPAQ
jgi:hypothetical protein